MRQKRTLHEGEALATYKKVAAIRHSPNDGGHELHAPQDERSLGPMAWYCSNLRKHLDNRAQNGEPRCLVANGRWVVPPAQRPEEWEALNVPEQEAPNA